MTTAEQEFLQWYQPDGRVGRASKKTDFVHPVGPHRGRTQVGWVMSMVTMNSQPYHSSNERELILLMGLMPTCINIRSQPRTFEYETADGIRRYTPDTAIDFSDRRTLYAEVKPEGDILNPDNFDKWARIKLAIEATDATFQLFSDAYIHRQPRRDNVLLLQHYRACTPDLEICHLIDLAFAKEPSISMQRLRTIAADSLLVRDNVRSLILRRHLTTDLNRPLDDFSMIQKVSRPSIANERKAA